MCDGKGRTSAPEEFGLREDMTLWLRETTHAGSRTWFQRYLPASLEPPPAEDQLELEGDPVEPPARDLDLAKPGDPIAHCWQWLPSDAFDFCHRRLTHFGCYQDVVDWRWQYYRLTIEDGLDVLRRMPESTQWIDSEERLTIRKDCLDWDRINAILRGEIGDPTGVAQKLLALASSIPGAISGALSAALFKPFFGALEDLSDVTAVQQLLCDVYNELRSDDTLVRKVHRRGLFHPQFLLSLRHREPYGYIAVHWDKRDDDLLPFEIPERKEEPLDVILRPAGVLDPAARIVARFHSHHPVPDIPRVTTADVVLHRKDGPDAVLRIHVSPASDDVDENLWRFKIGFVRRDSAGQCTAFETCFDRVRLSADRSSVDASGGHEYEWTVSGDTAACLAACCDAESWRTSATTLWFEDIVGHVGTADEVSFSVTAR